jgi:hypothetical protein
MVGIGRTNAVGGTALNVKVVPGLTQPGTASENTIWVKTERIGAWYFSATQPEEMQEWDVWFPTGTASSVEFNALKKNTLQVYPLSAKQYVGGEWKNVTAMSYVENEWKDWIFYLFHDGVLHPSVTGWDAMSLASVYTQGSVNVGEERISFTAGIRSDGWCTTLHCPLPAIDLTEHKTVIFDIEFAAHVNDEGSGKSARGNGVCIVQSTQAFDSAVAKHVATKASRQTVSLDVSSVTGEYYIGLFVCGTGVNQSNTGYCYEIRFD